MDTERRRLIKLVQSRPLLWKYKAYNADHLKTTHKLWTIISRKLGMKDDNGWTSCQKSLFWFSEIIKCGDQFKTDVKIVDNYQTYPILHILVTVAKAKWKGIRSNFRNEIKNATMLFTRPFNRDTYVPRGLDFKLLSFLLDDILAKEQGEKTNRLTKKTMKAIKSPKNKRKMLSEEQLVGTEEVKEVSEDIEVLSLENNSSECNIPIPSISTPTTAVQQPLHPLITVKPEFISEPNINHDYTPLQPMPFSNSISNNRSSVGFNITTVHRADDDYLFLMSCLTKLNSLSPARNMYIRYKIQELFFKEFNSEVTLT